MKISQGKLSIAVVIAIAFLILAKVPWVSYYPGHNDYGDQLFIDKESKLDSMNFEIRQAKQRLQHMENLKHNYVNGYEESSGFGATFLGVMKIRDTIGSPKFQYVVPLGGLGLKIEEYVGYSYLNYYTKDRQGYLSRTKLVRKGNENHYEYVDRKVDYKYSSGENQIMLVLKSEILRYLIIGFIFLLPICGIAYSIYLLIVFIKILIAISKNDAFGEINVIRLKRLYLGLLILSLYSYLLHILIYLGFSLFYPTDGVIITYSFWERDYLVLIFALVSYLVYLAFKKAKTIQQENDLTI